MAIVRGGEQLEARRLFTGVPALHSNLAAAQKLYLDFDGHITSGTSWNLRLDAIHSPPFDLDGHPDQVSVAERQRMVSIWERVAEDFRPFDVDVTTVDPTGAEPDIFTAGGRGQRIVFSTKWDTQTGSQWFTGDAAAVATDSWHRGQDTPVFVFSTHELAGELASHEIGHAAGLSHDGWRDESGKLHAYRGPHGHGPTQWSPIMGHGNRLTQWSRGEYAGATNHEPDIGILTSVWGRRPDDVVGIQPLPWCRPAFGPLGEIRSVQAPGVISHAADTDIFSLQVTAPDSRLRLDIHPWHNGPNLDVGVTLSNQFGIPLIDRRDVVANPLDRLSSHIDVLLQPGVYYLTVDGVGRPATGTIGGEDWHPGYSDYGSLGYYQITGAIAVDTSSVVDAAVGTVVDGTVGKALPWDEVIDAISAASLAVPQQAAMLERYDLNCDNRIDAADVDVLLGDILGTRRGDIDLDGRVTMTDVRVLAANFGRHDVGWNEGDVNGDRRVDFADFLIVASGLR